MSAFVPLLGAKLLPPDPGKFHLIRPRLEDRLRSSLERRATVILAGPGYGKTSLAARFLREWEGESIWLSLDASDRDVWLVFRYLIRGLREHAPEFAARTEQVWQDRRARPEEVESLCDLFISDAEESLGEKFLIVLDDVHHLESAAAGARMLRRLLAYLPGTLHLILLGRSLPEVGLKTLAAEGAIDLVPGDELLFTREETRELLTGTFQLPLPAAMVDKVHERTRGWPTALQLLRQTARLRQPRVDLPDELFVRTETEIFDYFSEEVFSAESPDARELLLASSLPSVLDPELLVEILPALPVREVLASLVNRKLFLSPLESGTELYAYDPLFRDFLRRKLRSEKGAEGLKELHVRYGEAFIRRGEWAQSLAHFREADETRRIAEVLRRHGEALVRSGQLDAVKEAARALESRGVRSAVAEALLGEALRLTGDYAAAAGHFERALAGPEKAIRLAGPLRASARQGLAYALLKLGQRQRAAEQAKQALAECGESRPALQARILNTLSILQYREEQHAEAVAGWREALQKARQAEDERLIRMIAHNLGLPHAVSGDFARASECFRILTGAGGSLGPEEGAAYLNLARIEALRGEYETAGRLLADAREIAHRLRLASLSADVSEAEGTLRRETGDLEGAREKYAEARARFTELGLQDVLESLAEEEAILAARAGAFQEAEALSSALVLSHRKADDREGLASALLAQGEILVRSGKNPKACETLVESARIFRALGRAYQECVAEIHLSLAAHRAGRAARARTAALRALRLSDRYGYGAAVGRVAALDAGFGEWLAGLSSAEGVPATRRKGAPAPPAGMAVAENDLTVRLLGPIEVYRDAANKIPARAWKLRRALEIFCYLAGARDRRATKEKIVDALWGDARLSVIEKNFHPTISFLRAALNHGHNVPKNFILFERGAYFLNPAHRYDIDAERFESGIRSARARLREGKSEGALVDYEAALALYRGPFLEEEYGAWTEAPRAHFEGLYLAALAEAARLYRDAGDLSAALACQGRRLEQDPLSEEASIDLMGTLGLAGDRGAVDKEFERLSRALADELGSAPAPGTVRAYQAARAASHAPGKPPAAGAGGRPSRSLST
ncbi:MAG TPA: BTAD domain-containing putative transcriptional regulator, partial [Candidatus Polarisedimenticolia bacterium]|nr:BTAD domain-containing putative transcriptional regulator [Candidatus Polarisedimenticolia bacterium]